MWMFFAFQAWKNIRRIEDEKLEQTQVKIVPLIRFFLYPLSSFSISYSSFPLLGLKYGKSDRIEILCSLLVAFPEKNEKESI